MVDLTDFVNRLCPLHMCKPSKVVTNKASHWWMSGYYVWLLCRSPIESGIPPLLKHSCEESNWLPCWPSRGQQVSQQRWILGNVHDIHLCQVWITLPTLALKPRGDIIRNPKHSFSGPISTRFFKRNPYSLCDWSLWEVSPVNNIQFEIKIKKTWKIFKNWEDCR